MKRRCGRIKAASLRAAPNGSLGAGNGVTREEAAVLMYRFAAYLKEDMSLSGNRLLDFKDGAGASEYARTALEWAVERGILSGMPDRMLSPKGIVTRAQTAAMLQRLCGVVNKDA